LYVVVLSPQMLLTCPNGGVIWSKSNSRSPVESNCEVRFGDGQQYLRLRHQTLKTGDELTS
jgi:hypothetical protein